jgi:putative transposase
MSPSERKTLIDCNRTDLSLTKQCKLLKISRSWLYYTPVGVNAETLDLMNEIDRVFRKEPFFPFRDHAAHNHVGQWAAARLQLTFPNLCSRLGGIVCVI